MTDSPWRLQILGAFELQQRGAAVEEFGSRLDEQLLAYVTLKAPASASREAIAGDLWPEADLVTSRKNLSFNLFQLKRRLAEHQIQEPIQDVRHSLRLSPSIEVDAFGFTQALAASTSTSSATDRVMLLDRAISMYGNGLLPDVNVSWLTPHQMQFSRLYQDAVRALADLTQKEGPLRNLMEHMPSTAWQGKPPEKPLQAQAPIILPAPPGDLRAFVKDAGEGLLGPDQQEWVARIGQLYPHIEKAYRNAIEHGRFDEAVQLVLPIWRFWHLKGSFSQGSTVFESLLTTGYYPSSSKVQAELLHAAGTLEVFGGELVVGRARLEDALALWREIGDTPDLLKTLINVGISQARFGRLEEAHETYLQCIAIAESLNDTSLLLMILFNAALCEMRRGNEPGARSYLEKRLTLLKGETSQGRELANTLAHLASVDLMVDDFSAASEHTADAQARFTTLQDLAGMVLCQQLLGRIAYRRGEVPDAIRLLRECVTTARSLGRTWELGTALGYLAICLEAAGETFEAASTMWNATSLLRTGGDAGAIERFAAELAQLKAGGG